MNNSLNRGPKQQTHNSTMTTYNEKKQVVVLPTAIVEVKCNEIKVKSRALIDFCSTCSYATEKFVRNALQFGESGEILKFMNLLK